MADSFGRTWTGWTAVTGATVVLLVAGIGRAGAAEGNDPFEIAAEIDRLIVEELLQTGVEPAPLVGDGDFLRRAMFDLAGTAPSPRQVARFVADPDPDKRAKLVDELVESDQFARNLARYWRDVIFSRATDQRSRFSQGTFEGWMAEQIREGRTWDEIATELLTAAGDVRENPATALIFAHGGDAQEIAGEVSRIFTGVQLQCANCHDHSTDRWTRDDFHTLAAYFPRLRVRQVMTEERRSFEIVSLDFGGGVGRRPGRGRFASEYFMPDPENPASRGRRIEPAFFLTGERVRAGLRDVERRQALAAALTSPANPWFSAAMVNRAWAEMLGEGFVTPVDDLGPDREPLFPQVFDRLRDGFTASGYDLKWLYRTIGHTEVYQRELRPRDLTGETPPFAAAAPTRLRADQVFEAVTQVIGSQGPRFGGGRRGRGGPFGFGGGRQQFARLFGFDPSTPQEDIVGSIPQALFLMNSPLVNRGIRGDGDTQLARILRSTRDDDEAVREMYRLVLARDPSDRELEICREHLAETTGRREAFEDLMWSLLNSSEFLLRR